MDEIFICNGNGGQYVNIVNLEGYIQIQEVIVLGNTAVRNDNN